MSEDDDDKMAKYDGLRQMTGVGTADAAKYASMGSMAPGAVGNVLEGAGLVLGTEAETQGLLAGEDFIAARLKISTDKLLGLSKALRGEHDEYDSGEVHAERGAGFGMKMGGAVVGAGIGATVGSFVPVVGTMIGGFAGGALGGMGASEFSALFIKQRDMTNAQFGRELCMSQDSGEMTPEHMMLLVARLGNESEREIIVRKMENGNKTGMDIDHIAEKYMQPVLLANGYYDKPQAESICEFAARLCLEGKVDAAHFMIDTDKMNPKPPIRQVKQQGHTVPSGNAQVGLDPSFNGRDTPVKANLPIMPSYGKSVT